MRHLRRMILLTSAIALAACDSAPAEPVVAEAPSALQIGSAKRQCVSTASLTGEIPSEISREICDCTIDRLVEEKHFTADSEPDEELAGTALNACIDTFMAENEGSSAEGE